MKLEFLIHLGDVVVRNVSANFDVFVECLSTEVSEATAAR
jgi:hypothetical protein